MVFFTVKRSRRKVVGNVSMLALTFGLGAGAATGIFGCSTAISVEEQKASETPAVSPAQPQPTTQEKLARPMIKEMTLEEQAFKIQELAVNEERGQTTLYIKFSKPVSQYRHFTLTMPSRVVLDIYGDAKGVLRTESFGIDTHWVGPLRVSSAEGYVHMVMDIAAASVPPYVIEPDDGGLKVIIGPVNPQYTARKNVHLVRDGKRTDVKVAEVKPTAPETTPQAPGQAVATAEKKYTGQKITLNFKDADIRNIFRFLAEVAQKNIVVAEDVKKLVTIRLEEPVPWDQAMDLLVEHYDLAKEEVGNVIRISTPGQVKKQKDDLVAAKKAGESVLEEQIDYFGLNYSKAKDLADKIKPLLNPNRPPVIVADERTNTLVVRGTEKAREEVNKIVSRLDSRTAQVLIESNLIETTPTFSRALGLKLEFDAPIHDNTVADRSAQVRSSFPAGAPATGLAPFFKVFQNRMGAFRNLNAELSAAENQGNIRIISRPSVVTLNNIDSTIQSLRILRVALPASTNIASGTGSAAGAAVATEKIPVGIILTVNPQVSSDGFVLMKITVKSSSLGTQSPGAVVPDELTREAISNVLVRDGETIVIGGIMKDTAQDSEAGIPFLKDIPVLGWLFKNVRWQKDFEELMVFITPRIIAAGSENLPTAEQLWREQLKKTEQR